MTLPDDWWTTGLENEPCDGCGIKPSKHAGHGSFTCKTCYEGRWCPKCHFGLSKDHVCASPEEAKRRTFQSGIDLHKINCGSHPSFKIMKALLQHHNQVCGDGGSALNLCQEAEDAKLLIELMEKDEEDEG